MITDQKMRNIERGGATPTKNVAYHLDDDGMVHISRILRNMYSKPIEAVVREYLANAVDAHTLAGKPVSEIVVRLPTFEFPTFELRDFGPGLSEEETEHQLFGFGVSGKEKRTSNRMVGGFGIGAKAASSVTDQFFYHVYHGGQVIKWRCYLDEHDAGRAEVVDRRPSSEPTGIEIQIPIAPTAVDECVQSYARVAWALKDGPKVKRGQNSLNRWVSGIHGNVKSLDDLIQWFDNPIHWKGTFVLNEQPIEWIWSYRHDIDRSHVNNFPGDWGTTSELVYCFLGWQQYVMDVSNVGDGLQTGDTEFFATKMMNNGTLVFKCPIGTLPLSPTRETLQYTTMCQKLMVGMITAFLGQWLKLAKDRIDEWSGKLNTMEDAQALHIKNPGGLCSWLIRVLKERKILKDTDDVTNLARWKIKQYDLNCFVELRSHPGMYSRELGVYATWGASPLSSLTANNHYTVMAKCKRLYRYDNSVIGLKRYSLTGEWNLPHGMTYDKKGGVFDAGNPIVVPPASTLIITVDPSTDYDQETGALRVSPRKVAAYVRTLLSSSKQSLQEILEEAGLVKPATNSSRLGAWWQDVKDSRRAELAFDIWFLEDTTPEKLVAENPWLQGIPIFTYKSLADWDKKIRAATRAQKPLLDPNGVVTYRPRAKALPLDVRKYHMWSGNVSGAAIDVEALKAASSRVYVQMCRDHMRWPGMESAYMRPNSSDASRFNDLAAALDDPKALGLLVFHTEEPKAPNPTRYGDWTPYQKWFAEGLQRKADEWKLKPDVVAAQQLDIIINKEVVMPLGAHDTTRVEFAPGIVSVECLYKSHINALEAWFMWLWNHVTSPWGRAVLESWDALYSWSRPEGWKMLRLLETTCRFIEDRTVWQDLDGDSRSGVDQLSPWFSQVRKVGTDLDLEPVRSAGHLQELLKRRPELKTIVAAEKLVTDTFGSLQFEIKLEEADWQAWLRKSWVVFEGAWVPGHQIPALPKYP